MRLIISGYALCVTLYGPDLASLFWMTDAPSFLPSSAAGKLGSGSIWQWAARRSRIGTCRRGVQE